MSTSRGHLARAIETGIVEVVGINDVKFVTFDRKNGPYTIGAKGLSACSVVVLVSDHAAILAHVGPNEIGAEDPASFLRLAEAKMSQLESEYSSRRQDYFTTDSHAYLIFATFNSNPTSPEQTAIMRTRLEALGVPLVRDISYERSSASLLDDASKAGTVWVAKVEGQPRVFLEDEVVTPKHLLARASQVISSTVASSSSRSIPAVIQQQSGAGIWTHTRGSNTYILRNEQRQATRQSASPPTNCPIHLYDKDGKWLGVGRFDGQEWHSGQ